MRVIASGQALTNLKFCLSISVVGIDFQCDVPMRSNLLVFELYNVSGGVGH